MHDRNFSDEILPGMRGDRKATFRRLVAGSVASALAAVTLAAFAIVSFSGAMRAETELHHRVTHLETQSLFLSNTIPVEAQRALIHGDRICEASLTKHIAESTELLELLRATHLAPLELAEYETARAMLLSVYDRARILVSFGHCDQARAEMLGDAYRLLKERADDALGAFWLASDEELTRLSNQSLARVLSQSALSLVLLGCGIALLVRAIRMYRVEANRAVSTLARSAQAELIGARRSNERFVQSVIDASLDAFVLIAPDGTVRDWNRRAEEIFGFSAMEAVDRPLDELIIPEPDRAVHRAALARYHAGTTSRVVGRRIELNAIRKDGAELPVELSVVPINRDGETYFAGFVRDISDRRGWEETLQTNEHRLRLALQGAGIGMWDWDLVTNRTHFNEQWYTMLGFDFAELPMTLETWESLCHPDDIPNAKLEIQRHFDGETARYHCETRLRCKDGSYKWILDVGEVSHRDATGKPTRMTGVHINIDDLRRTEADRRRIETILQVAIDHLPARVFWKDREGNYLGCSQSFAQDAGLEDPLEIIGRPDRDLVWHAHAERYRADDLAVMESGTSKLNYEEPIDGPDGSPRWLRTNKVPLRDDEGRVIGVIGTYEDITAERNTKERMAEALAEAQSANLAKSEFLANMSHEIRTPMNAILGFAELLNEEALHSGSPRTREFVATIVRNANHLLAIINDILDLSKIEAGKLRVERVAVQPSAVLLDVIELMRARAEGKGVALICEFLTPIPLRIESDTVRLRQILMNLIGNAIKFTEVGSVRVSVSKSHRPDGSSALNFAIRDTGIGIEPAHMGKLFDAFEQADTSMARKFGGTGLGLQISQRLAGMLGGEIRVESKVGVGSLFTLTLDVTAHVDSELEQPSSIMACANQQDCRSAPQPTTASPAPIAAPAASGELAGARILLVEDGPDNQRLLSFHLRRAGAEVTLADNGRYALEALCCDAHVDAELIYPPPFDLVLMDMQMPEMDGYTATKRLRDKGYQGNIVALTAHAMDYDAHRCIDAGCTAYACKPISKADLIQVCKQHLAHAAAAATPSPSPIG